LIPIAITLFPEEFFGGFSVCSDTNYRRSVVLPAKQYQPYLCDCAFFWPDFLRSCITPYTGCWFVVLYHDDQVLRMNRFIKPANK